MLCLIPPHHTNTMTTEEKITEILYKNSHDDSVGLNIRFEKIQEVITLLASEIKEAKIKMLEGIAEKLRRKGCVTLLILQEALYQRL
jgi:hypothetical protein